MNRDNEQPTVSIIVPIYNGEKYLREALDSVRCQSYSHWECLCISDGSNDSSVEIVEEYAKDDSRFVLIEKENEGVAATRNYGIEHSTGEYFALLDQDDVLHERFLELSLTAIKRTNADVLAVGIKTVYDNCFDTSVAIVDCVPTLSEDVIGEWTKAFRPGWRGRRLDINAWGKLYRRASLGDVRFPAGVFGADDFVFTMRMMLKGGKWAFLNDVELYIYRMWPENITSRMPAKYVCGVLKAAMIVHYEIQASEMVGAQQRKDYYKKDSKRLLSWAIKKTIRNHYVTEDITEIRKLLKAVRVSGALRFYSICDRLKYELFVRGHMRLLVMLFLKLKAKK